MLQVIVKNVAGRLLEGELSEHSTITELKAWVHDQWQIPPQCQEILSDARVLPGSAFLVDCIQEIDGARSVTAIVSLENVCTDLRCTDVSKQLAALAAIAELRSLAGEVAIDAVMLLLQKPKPEVASSVRAEAVRTLSHVAGCGSDGLILTVSACLLDIDCNVQQAAVQALGNFTYLGQQQDVIAAIFRQSEQLPDPPSRERYAHDFEDYDTDFFDCDREDEGVLDWKLRATLQFFVTGDAIMVQALSAARGIHGHEVEALDDQVICACFAQLKNKVAHVRRISIKALSSYISVTEDSTAIVRALIARLSDPAWSVKVAALQNLSPFALQGHQRVIVALTGLVQDPSDSIRSLALDVLGALLDKGSVVGAGAVSRFLADPNWHIRQSAVQILGDMVEEGGRFDYADIVANLRWWNFPQVAKVLIDWQSRTAHAALKL